MDDALAVIMPVYNEEGAIGTVLNEWIEMLDSLSINYHIHVYNDGSKDNSLVILNRLADKYAQIKVHDKSNTGHGPTILQGYRDNSVDYSWVFQADSDGEMPPDCFPELWKHRQQFDFLIGRREGRAQPLARKIVSCVSRLCVWIFYGKGVWDVNSPYRLMRTEKFRNVYQRIPSDTFAPNLIISGIVARRKLRLFEMYVPHSGRKTGSVSIKQWKLFKAALRSLKQTILFSLSR